MPTGTVIREMREAEYPLLEDSLYEAIFIPKDFDDEVPHSITRKPELVAFIEGFGTLPDNHHLVAEIEGTMVRAAWTCTVKAYDYVDSAISLLSTSLLPGHRGRGIGMVLVSRLLDHLRTLDRRRVSLSVQKASLMLHLYRRVGFVDYRGRGDELTVIRDPAEGAQSR